MRRAYDAWSRRASRIASPLTQLFERQLIDGVLGIERADPAAVGLSGRRTVEG